MSNSLKNNDYSNISLTKNNSLSDKFGMSDELGLRGTVIQVGDGILKIAGASEAMAGEVLLVETKAGDVPALALNLETQAVGAVLLGVDTGVLFGDTVRCSGRLAQIRVISDLANQSSEPSMLFGLLDSLGKLVQPYSPPISSMTASDTSDTSLEQPGQAAIANYALSELQSIEAAAPSIIDRLSVSVPLATGILAIDAMVPIGRGQRQLIIGDRQTGKTSIATDAIINQRDSDVACFYIGIGQKASSVGSVMAEVRGAKMFTATFIAATPDAPAAAQYLAPYSGAAIAEAYMNKLQVDTLVVYDDLSKHACAYREMCLLLRRPPGREAFPADVFYLHSRLLERSANLARGGSMTALPIIETQAEDLSAYIPTNVISITDGQIYLSTELFNASLRPAINAGLSVSRVGAAAQSSLLKGVAGSLKLTVAQLAELETFSQFSADLDADTQKRLAFGQRLKEILKQRQGNPLSEVAQVALIWSVFFGALGACPIGDLAAAKQALVNCKSDCQEIVDSINRTSNVS